MKISKLTLATPHKTYRSVRGYPEKMTEIVKNLYLGDCEDASTFKNGCLVCCANEIKGGDIFIPLTDDLKGVDTLKNSKNILPILKYIHINLKNDKKVLVYCARGISRSAAIVVLYLMASEQISYTRAMKIVGTARDIVNINLGFVLLLDSDVFEGVTI